MTCRISFRDWSWTQVGETFTITLVTDIPCHCYMRWSLNEPQKHIVPILRRGIAFSSELYFCFTAYEDNEQNEAGDTLIHTFTKPDWPYCQTRHFYFWGTVAGEVCVSTSVPVKLHNTMVPPPGPPAPGFTRVNFCQSTAQFSTYLATTVYIGIVGCGAIPAPVDTLNGSYPQNATLMGGTSGRLHGFRVYLSGSPGAGKSYRFTLLKNGVPTVIVITITGAATYGQELITFISYVAGDYFQWKVELIGNPTARRFRTCCAGEAGDMFMMSAIPLTAVGSRNAQLHSQASSFSIDPSVFGFQSYCSIAGTVCRLRLLSSAPPGVGKSYAVTLYKNGNPTDITATISEGDTTATDELHYFDVVKGDRLYYHIETTVGSTTPVALFVTLDYWREGEPRPYLSSPMISSIGGTLTYYLWANCAHSGNSGSGTIESNFSYIVSQLCNVGHLYIHLKDPPGVGKSIRFILNKNGINTPIECTIAGNDTFGESTQTPVSFDPPAQISVAAIPSGNPSGTYFQIGLEMET